MLAFLFIFQVWSADFKTPWLSGPVIDEVSLLQADHKDEISNLVQKIRNNQGPQIQIYITESLQGLPIEKASIDIVDQWKLGDAKRDDGLLFLVAPRERKIRIEVGQGLEGFIPDVYAKRINEDIVVPLFRQGQMSEGVRRGVLAVVALLEKEGVAKLEELTPKRAKKKELPTWLIILIWLIIIFLGRGGLLGSRSLHGGWGGGFGGGSFGGGGGWSGGGGGFSGGGSSSSW
jgi:uncharacterized protein